MCGVSAPQSSQGILVIFQSTPRVSEIKHAALQGTISSSRSPRMGLSTYVAIRPQGGDRPGLYSSAALRLPVDFV